LRIVRSRIAHWQAGHAAGGRERAHATIAMIPMITPAPMVIVIS
jgi:hypothetical protein